MVRSNWTAQNRVGEWGGQKNQRIFINKRKQKQGNFFFDLQLWIY
jgi:hypothetical protein